MATNERPTVKSATDLDVYKVAYELAMEIFHASKHWPKEEQFSLTDQVRRSSRSVCSNLREAWSKRRYEAHFISKLTDCDGFRLVEPTARRVKTVKQTPGLISPGTVIIWKLISIGNLRKNAAASEPC